MNTALTRTHKCVCGERHTLVAMLFGVGVVYCPEIDDDAAHLVLGLPIYIRMGREPSTLRMAVMELGERVKALEGKRKG